MSRDPIKDAAARKRYYDRNREKILAQHKKYQALHREHRAELRRARYIQRKDIELAQTAAWALANREKRLSIYKRYHQRHADKLRQQQKLYNEIHREERNAYVVRYRETETGRLVAVAASQRRRARKRNAGSVSTEDISRILDVDRCYLCGKKFTKKRPATLDHVIPLMRGGNMRSQIWQRRMDHAMRVNT